MSLAKIFGNDWTEFIENWCAGAIPTTDQVTTELGLNTLLQFWPDYVQKIANNPTKGLLTISHAVRIGLILEACKSLNGFEKILQRIKSGESSALSELKFTERLLSVGLLPQLEPALNGKLLDTKLTYNNEEVYFEVITPETSEATKEAVLQIEEFATELLTTVAGKRVEVFFFQDLTSEIREMVMLRIKKPQNANGRFEIPDIAIITIQDEPFDFTITPQTEKKDSAVINVAKITNTLDQKTMAIVRLCITDSRGKRLLSSELHHFSKDNINILVMDVTKVTEGINKWMRIIEGCLQPNQNRRFSAVLFFSESFYSDKLGIKQMWNQIINEHSYKKVPKGLLEMIVSNG